MREDSIGLVLEVSPLRATFDAHQTTRRVRMLPVLSPSELHFGVTLSTCILGCFKKQIWECWFVEKHHFIFSVQKRRKFLAVSAGETLYSLSRPHVDVLSGHKTYTTKRFLWGLWRPRQHAVKSGGQRQHPESPLQKIGCVLVLSSCFTIHSWRITGSNLLICVFILCPYLMYVLSSLKGGVKWV